MKNYNVTFIDVATTFLKSIHKKHTLQQFQQFYL